MSTTDNNKAGDAKEQAPKTEPKATDNTEQHASDNKGPEGRNRNRNRNRGKRGGARAGNDSSDSQADQPAADTPRADSTKASPKAAAKPADAGSSAPPAAAQTTSAGATWPGKLALALSFAALGASGYLYWISMQQTQQNVQLRSEINAKVDSMLSGARSDLSSNMADVNRQLGEVKAQASNDKNNVNELQNRLTRSMKQVMAQQHNSRKDWLLAEVEYLLRLANQRILMENTVNGALQLLKSADKILAETDDVTIYDIRKAVAADIAALEAVPLLDSEGLFLKLGAMNQQVANLSVTPLSQQHQLPDMLKEITPESVQAGWASGVQASWGKAMAKLESLIVIQHRDEPVKPLLSRTEILSAAES